MRGGARIGAAAAVAVLALIAWFLVGDGSGGGNGTPDPRTLPPVPAEGGGADPCPGPGPSGPARAGGAPAAGAPEPEEDDGRPRYAVRGRVVDAGGRPVAGATVEATGSPVGIATLDITALLGRIRDDPPALDRATTDASGSFLLRRVPSVPVMLRADAEGFGPGFTDAMTLAPQPPEHAVVIVLGAGMPVSGRVFLAGGTPVEGAEVRVVPNPEGPEGFSHRSVAVTDGKGEFRFDALSPGRYIGFVLAEGRAVHLVQNLQVPRDGPLEVELPAGGNLGVTVRDEAGLPVADARILAAVGKGAGSLAEAVTGPDGRGLVEGLAPGGLDMLMVRRTGFVPEATERARRGGSERIRIREGETVEHEVTLRRGASVRGRVLDASGGAPIPGAEVRVFGGMEDLLGGSAHATSGADGAYRLEGVREGTAVLLVRAPGHAQPLDALSMNPRPPGEGEEDGPRARFTVVVPAAGEVEKDLLLDAAGSIAGRVLAPDGSGVPGAEVSPAGKGGFLELGSLLQPDLRAISDAEGRFRIAGVPAGGKVALRASAHGFVAATSGEITLEPGGAREGLDLRLGAGATVHGIVRTPAGTPAPEALITWAPETEKWRLRNDMAGGGPERAGADGRFVLRAVPEGRIVLRAALAGFVPAEEEVEAPEGGTVEVALALRAAATISGTVLDDGGRPVEGARVFAGETGERGGSGGTSASGIAGKDGGFVVADLPMDGTFRLNASAAEHIPAQVEEVPAGATGVSITLRRGMSVTGRVEDEGGRGIPSAGVSARPADGKRTGWGRTGDDGSFEITGLEPGEVRLVVSGGGADAFLQEETPAVAAGSRGVVIRMRRGAVLSGRVVDDRGDPVAKIQVTARGGEGNRFSRGTRSGDDGSFAVAGLPEGRFEVVASGGGYLPATVTDAATGRSDLVLRVRKGREVAGRVAFPEEGGPDRAVVALREGSRILHTRTTDREGRFRFDGLEEGDYGIAAWPADGRKVAPDAPGIRWTPVMAGEEDARVPLSE